MSCDYQSKTHSIAYLKYVPSRRHVSSLTDRAVMFTLIHMKKKTRTETMARKQVESIKN